MSEKITVYVPSPVLSRLSEAAKAERITNRKFIELALMRVLDDLDAMTMLDGRLSRIEALAQNSFKRTTLALYVALEVLQRSGASKEELVAIRQSAAESAAKLLQELGLELPGEGS